jgi:hypothetical protein
MIFVRKKNRQMSTFQARKMHEICSCYVSVEVTLDLHLLNVNI